MSDEKKTYRRTRAVQAGIGQDKAFGAVIPPLYLSSTYKMKGFEDFPAYQYSRTRNPTRDVLAGALAELEGGYGAHITASGMAALTLVLHLLAPDDLLVAPYDCYGRAYRLMAALAEKGHFKVAFLDQYDEGAAVAIAALKPKMVLIESPSNPVMRIADIAAISGACKDARPDALIVCDNTFLSPILQHPIELGGDIVIHSTTKFLNGHSDVVGGAVVAKTKELWNDLDFWANSLGLIGAPFDSYMTLRGLRTLEVRITRAQENAAAIAAFLEAHPAIARVYYPGLTSHPQHALAATQQGGAGAMLSFTLKGGKREAKRFVDGLRIFALAQSLGGTESLLNHPASMTHVSMGAEAREQAGVSDNLLRLSAGIEHIDDLIADLQAALEQALPSIQGK